MKLQNLFVATCLLAGAAALVAQSLTMPGAKVGGRAPGFTLTDSMGKAHNLSDFKGKYVVLEWTNHQCPFVVKHYKNGDMQATQKWAKDKGIVWLSIVSSAEGKQGYVTAEMANEIRKNGGHHSAATLLDKDGAVGKLYAARTTPHMFVINPEQTVIYMGAIDDKSTPDTEDIAGARNHVKEALNEAMNGKPVSVASTQPYGCSVKY